MTTRIAERGDERREFAGVRLTWLHERETADPELSGGKAANLALLAGRYPVPAGFVISGPAGMRPPHELIRGAYAELGRFVGAAEPSVAVRSSAVDEDGAGASFAGQHESYLNVNGASAVASAICETVGSFGSERAAEYRRSHGLDEEPDRVAVLVQWLVPAEASGVVFSANPVTGDRDEVVVTASFGLGESIVGGTVTPDTFLVRAPHLTVSSRLLGDKRRMTVRAAQGTREVGVPPRLARTPAIGDEQVVDAARLAVALEHDMGWPVDIEVAWHRESIHLLQCRPITTLTSV